MKEKTKFFLILLVFIGVYLAPFSSEPMRRASLEAFMMLQEYAREHVLLCLVPAFFIAGAIAVFVSQASVLKYFGAEAKKVLAYSVASISGTILAVCSCTVLPLFAGIYTRGAGIGPATAFLYSGPAINVLAIILTARILGWQLGLARAVGAIIFAVVVGLSMHFIYRKEEKERSTGNFFFPDEDKQRPLWKDAAFMATMVGILVFANWAKPKEPVGFFIVVWQIKWFLTGALGILLAYQIVRWFQKGELLTWTGATWGFAKQILPLLFGGVLVAGLLLGRPGHEALLPSRWVESLLGGNSLGANLFASAAGALMYFATLTEIPILQGLLGNGMGQGPALALLLAGPALSLPNMLVIRSVIGTQKTLVFVSIVVALSTIAGMIFGSFVS